MGTVGLILLFVAIVLLDIRKVWRNKEKKELLVYFSILIIAFSLSELHILGFKVMGLNQLVDKIIRLFGI